jgi:hypothetical protein
MLGSLARAAADSAAPKVKTGAPFVGLVYEPVREPDQELVRELDQEWVREFRGQV